MKKSLSIMSIMVLSVLITTALTASAHYSGTQDGQMGPRFEEDHAQHEEMKQAIESDDFDTWAELVSTKDDYPAPITEETFKSIQEAHELREAGEHEAAKEIMDGLGLQPHRGEGKMRKGGPEGKNFDPEKHEAIEAAMESGDYNAWLEAVGDDGKMTEFINADNFSKLAEIHKLREAGEHEAAKELADELGLPEMGPRHGGKMGQRGQFGGQGEQNGTGQGGQQGPQGQ